MVELNNPKAHVIWRTHSPVAFISCDYRIYSNTLRAGDFEHETLNDWVPKFNEVMKAVAAYYQDPIIDWDVFARSAAAYFMTIPEGPISIKNDYIHFNAGGIPRYNNLFIQHIVEHFEMLDIKT